jgi:hypothetical protein
VECRRIKLPSAENHTLTNITGNFSALTEWETRNVIMYKFDKPDNLVAMFEESVAKHANNRLFGTKNKQGVYEWLTYNG